MRQASIPLAFFTIFGCGSDVGSSDAGPAAPELIVSMGPLPPAVTVASTVSLNQLDVTFDDGAHPNSPWGEVVVGFTGVSGTLYFNLSVNGVWRIQNMPVLSREGAGVAQDVTFLFDLGVSDGTDVPEGDLAWELSTGTLAGAPAPASTVSFGARTWAINSGIRRREITYEPPPPTLEGGMAIGDKAAHRNFPNQQANMNECVPAALSNSLRWMNTAFGLGLEPGETSIAAMKLLTGWTAAGAPQQWWGRKRRQFKDLIETSTIPKRNISQLHDAVRRGCDVEININHHVVAVTGSQQLANGTYALDLTHDPNQKDGQPPGPEGTQTVTWDPKTKTFSGAPWLQGKGALLIVSECSKQQT